MPTANGNLPDPSSETPEEKDARLKAEARLHALATQLAHELDKLPTKKLGDRGGS